MRSLTIMTEGKARINVIETLYDEPNFFVAEIDMDSKYIRPIVAFGSEEPSEVILMAFEGALHLADTDEQTCLLMPEHTADWEIMADGGRYTIRIVAWKRPEVDTDE